MKDTVDEVIASLPKYKFKKDAYMRRRGTPAMLAVLCAHCRAYVMSYQKDGDGPLLRCYLDRIHHPKKLAGDQHEEFSKKGFPNLCCDACQSILGFPIIYKKEKRPAYHLTPGSFVTKKISA